MWDSNKFLLRIQICVHILAIISAGCVFFPLGTVTETFQWQCVLYARLSLKVTDVNGTDIVVVDEDASEWTSTNICYYTTYLPVVCAIHAFAWCWFLVYLWRSLEEEGRVITLYLPSILLHVILVVCVIISSLLISVGFREFCDHFIITPSDKTYSCQQLQELTWESPLNVLHKPFYKYLEISQVATWLLLVVLIVQCVIATVTYCKHVTITFVLMGSDDDSTSTSSDEIFLEQEDSEDKYGTYTNHAVDGSMSSDGQSQRNGGSIPEKTIFV